MTSGQKRAGFIAFVLLAAAPALADNIDGEWCNAGGRRMSIKGADIVTPTGTPIRGETSTNFVSYVVPAGEPHAGVTVRITYLAGDLLHAREGAADQPPELWRRCPAPIPYLNMRSPF